MKKAETLAEQSHDMRDTSRKVKNKMWWKNKKVMIGIVVVIIIVLAIILAFALGWFNSIYPIIQLSNFSI